MFRGRWKEEAKTIEESKMEKSVDKDAEIIKIQCLVRRFLANRKSKRVSKNVYLRVFDPTFRTYFWVNKHLKISGWTRPKHFEETFTTKELEAVNTLQRNLRGFVGRQRASHKANQIYMKFYDVENDTFYFQNLQTKEIYKDLHPYLLNLKIKLFKEDEIIYKNKLIILELQNQLKKKEDEIVEIKKKRLQELEDEVLKETLKDIEEKNETKYLKNDLGDKKRSKYMDDWTTDELCLWLGELKLNQYLQAIFDNRVDGALFVNLNEPEFAELGITNRLHLRKLELGMKGYRFRSLRRKEKKYKKLNEDDFDEDDLVSEYAPSELSALIAQEDDDETRSTNNDDDSFESESEGNWSEEDEIEGLLAEQKAQIKLDKANMKMTMIMKGNAENFPMIGDIVRVKYTCYVEGKLIFSTKNVLEKPWIELIIGTDQVIKGFDRALQQMSLGERSRITFSPNYAYGEEGLPPHIPPNSNITFDLTLLGFRPRTFWVKPLIQDINTREKPFHTDLKESIILNNKSGLNDIVEKIFTTSLILTEDPSLMGLTPPNFIANKHLIDRG